ncbi:MAG: hypothetical protein SVV67_11315, partial [Bacillota bacterium]|nr:hypothetical protein [Bacillota bacterium]
MFNLHEVIVRPVFSSEEQRFQKFMHAYHYLTSLPKISETIWYVATFRDQWVAIFSFSAAAVLCGMRGYEAIWEWANDLSQQARSRFRCRYRDKRYHDSRTPDQANPQKTLATNRGHWTIENCCHYILDWNFDEDRSRISKGHGPENITR